MKYYIYEADDFLVIHQPGCTLLPVILPGHKEDFLWNNLGQIKFFSVSLHHKCYNYT
jgi:hypothetical protein